jgi:mono/diheme cytochrome c family protein
LTRLNRAAPGSDTLIREEYSMRRFAPLFASLVLAACACSPPQPAYQGPAPIGDTGSAVRGRAYAQEACASCHAITPGNTMSPHPDAPPFAELAQTPGMNGMALNVWLHSEHEQMPHMIVDSAHVEDLWAYMSTLESQPSGNR